MKITLLAVGKTERNWVKDGLDVYVARLRHYVNFELRELAPPHFPLTMPHEMVKQKEGELILKTLNSDDRVVLLDENGVERRSADFAAKIGADLQLGRNLVFVIGGPFGFSGDVYARADEKISLSRMTFPHQMVRVVFAEQLYRAFTIINGERYHHE